MKRCCPLLLACACSATPPLDPAPPQPHILVVLLDTVRADRLSPYGSPRDTSPNLARLAEQGLLFEDVTAPSAWTWPSHASLFTGQPPWVHGAHIQAPDAPGNQPIVQHLNAHMTRLSEDLPTLAETLGRAGYRTACLSANPLLDPALGLTRGFSIAEHQVDHDALLERALDLMTQEPERPFFLFVNLMPAHHPAIYHQTPWTRPHEADLRAGQLAPWLQPYAVPKNAAINLYKTIEGESLPGFGRLRAGQLQADDPGLAMLWDLYDGELARADELLGTLVEGWERRDPQGVVAVTSDHGEYFGEHGLWEHGRNVRAPILEVPLVLRAPGRLPAGQRVQAPVELLGLHDGLLTLAGAGQGSAALLDVAEGGEPGPVRVAVWPDRRQAETIGGIYELRWRLYREGRWALVWNSAGQRQLFDLDRDEGMERDLAAQKPGRLEELWVRAQRAVPEEGQGTGAVELDGEQEEALRGLGYVE